MNCLHQVGTTVADGFVFMKYFNFIIFSLQTALYIRETEVRCASAGCVIIIEAVFCLRGTI